MDNFGIIKELRKKKNLSARALGEIIELSQQYISDIENGKTKPSIPVLNKLAEYFNVSVDFLLGINKGNIMNTSDLYKDLINQKIPIENLATNVGISAESFYKILKSEKGATYDDYMKLGKWYGYSEKECKEFYLKNSPSAEESEFSNIQFPDFVGIPIMGTIRAGQPIMTDEYFEGYMPTDKRFISKDRDYFYLRVKGDSMDKEFKEDSLVLIQKQDFIEPGEIGAVLVNGYEATVKKVFIKDKLITLMPQSNNPEHQPQIYDMTKEEVKILGKVILAVKKY